MQPDDPAPPDNLTETDGEIDDGPDARQVEQAIRWRLILGQHADESLGFDSLRGLGGSALDGILGDAERLETPLSYIYDREHSERTHRRAGQGGGSGLSVPMWLSRVRDLFPREAVQVMERDALTRYGLHELVTDAEVLRKAEPSDDLLRAILQFKHLMKGPVLEVAREIVAEVVGELSASLETECRPALYGPVAPRHRSPVRSFKNTDWTRTIRKNLKHFDPEQQRLVAERIHFRHRQRRRSPWHILVAVDQSGSMTDSLIHAAVMAAIFTRLPSVEVTLVLWDHRLVDVSSRAHDPIEVLMGCQLGGGTRMLPAMRYCADRITDPRRSLFVLISDWFVGGERAECLALAESLNEGGTTCIGLSALDADCRPTCDERFARDLAGHGWFVAAMTPRKLAEHIGRVIA